jgi:2-polyprenyl-3-methyl-5-hydroxy-6-metoxy-1,4-benzoquinol methylase
MGMEMNTHYAGLFKSLDEIPDNTGTYIRYTCFKKYCKNKIVTDIGCGGGYGTHIIAEVAKKIYGLDFVKSNVMFCKEYWAKENIEYSYFDMNKHNMKCKSDVIIMSEVIEHLENTVEETIDKIEKYLNPKGYLCLTFPEDEEERKEDNHKQFNIRRKEVCIFLNENNFNVIEEFDYMGTGKSSLIVAQKK